MTTTTELLPEAQVQVNVVQALPEKVTAGDRVEMRVIFPPNFAGAEPEFAETLAHDSVPLGDGRLLAWKKISDTEGVLVWTAYRAGNQNFAPVKFVKEGKPVFSTPAQSIAFGSLGGQAQQQKDDIYPPMSVGFPAWIVVGIGILTLLVFAVLVWWLVRWSKKRQAERLTLASIPKALSPLEEFEKRKFSVEMKNFLEKEAFKPHYFGLSEAAKKFLARAYRCDAEDKTTRELVSELESIGMSDTLIDSWEKIFEEMDVIKFTDQKPIGSAAGTLSSRLSDLVRASYSLSPAGKEAALITYQTKGKP